MFIEEIERLQRRDTFIYKAQEKYQNKYDYSNVRYLNSTTKVLIVCREHGEFMQSPAKHLIHKYGCPMCARRGFGKERRITQEEFKKTVFNIYGDRYEYDIKTIPTKSSQIDIYCKKHGNSFKQVLHLHLSGRLSCRECINDKKREKSEGINKDLFIQKFCEKFGTDFDFSKVTYINNTTSVTIKCLKHKQVFKQVPRNIIRYDVCSCKKCKQEKRNNI